MTGPIDGGFRTESISFDDVLGIFYGSADPSVGAGLIAPIGSLYIRTNGELWQKFDSADTDWGFIESSATSSPNSIAIQDEGTPLGSFETINFTGSTTSVTDVGGVATVNVQPPVVLFGTEYQYEEDDTVSITVSDIWQTKLTLTTPNLPSGDYRIAWTFRYNHDNTNNDVECRVVRDSTVVLDQIVYEPQDAAGDFSSTGSGQRFPCAGFIHETLSGVNTFEIQFRSSVNGVDSAIWDARMEFWRIQ